MPPWPMTAALSAPLVPSHTDKIEILEDAISYLPAGHSDRALVLASLCKELTYGSPLERRSPWPKRPYHRQVSGGDAVIVRVLNVLTLVDPVPPLPAVAGLDGRCAGPGPAAR